MTEQEKMKKGCLWGDDEENMAPRARTKALVKKFNDLPSRVHEGAGSVATKDIPANVAAFGAPCKVYLEINERDEEYYFKDRRFDEQPE